MNAMRDKEAIVRTERLNRLLGESVRCDMHVTGNLREREHVNCELDRQGYDYTNV